MDTLPTPDLERDMHRGGEAKRILESEAFVEARKYVDSQLRNLRTSIPVSDTDMMVRLVLMEQLAGWFFTYFEHVIQTGDSAQQVLKLRESRVDQMKQAMRHGLRNIGLY